MVVGGLSVNDMARGGALTAEVRRCSNGAPSPWGGNAALASLARLA